MKQRINFLIYGQKIGLGLILVSLWLTACGEQASPPATMTPTTFPTLTPTPSLTDIQAVCNQTGVITEAVTYNPTEANDETIYPVLVMYGSYEISRKLPPQLWLASGTYSRDRLALVACVELTAEKNKLCNYEDTYGNPVYGYSIREFSYDYTVTVYTAQTGDKIGQKTFNTFTTCPFLVNTNTYKVYENNRPKVPYDSIVKFIGDYAQGRLPIETSTPETQVETAGTIGCDDPLGCVIVAPEAPIRVASAFMKSQPQASLGIDSLRGVEIAINNQQKILGHPIELQDEDSGCKAETGKTVATKLASDDTIVAVIGHSCSTSCISALPIYEEAGLTIISPSCSAPPLTDPLYHTPSFLRTIYNDQLQGQIMAEFVYHELGLRKAATISDNTLYANTLQRLFVKTFTKLGGQITTQQIINTDAENAQSVLAAIAKEKPEFIYYPIFINEGAIITTQAKTVAGLENVYLGGADGFISIDFITAAGEASEGMYVSSLDFNFSGVEYENFIKIHSEKYGEPPMSVFHAQAYDAANILFKAIEKVAQHDTTGNLIIGRQALRDALYDTKDFKGLTGMLTCNSNGDCAEPKIVINEVKDGQYVPIHK